MPKSDSNSNVTPLPVKTSDAVAKAKREALTRAKALRGKKPGPADLAYHAETMVRKDHHISEDRLVTSVSEDSRDPVKTLHNVQISIAREASALEFDRLEQARYGKDTQTISTRRIAALKEVADLEVKIRTLRSEGSLDLHSESMQKLVSFWIEKIQKVASDVLSAEDGDVFINALAASMENWEEEAASIIR